MNDRKRRVIVWGDSILAGIVYDDEEKKYRFLDKSCLDYIEEETEFEIINRSKFCQTTGRALKMMKTYLEKDHNFEIAVIELGGNDCDFDWKEIAEHPHQEHQPKTSVAEYAQNIILMIQEIQKYGIRPMIVSLPPIDATRYFQWISQGLNVDNIKHWLKSIDLIYRFQEKYNTVLLRIAGQYQIPVIHIREELLDIHDYDQYLCIDGIHLNQQGHKKIKSIFENIRGDLQYEPI